MQDIRTIRIDGNKITFDYNELLQYVCDINMDAYENGANCTTHIYLCDDGSFDYHYTYGGQSLRTDDDLYELLTISNDKDDLLRGFCESDVVRELDDDTRSQYEALLDEGLDDEVTELLHDTDAYRRAYKAQVEWVYNEDRKWLENKLNNALKSLDETGYGDEDEEDENDEDEDLDRE